MILSDREILAAIARSAIRVTPCPPAESQRWSPTALDLTLDAELRPWTELPSVGEEIVINPALAAFRATDLVNKYTTPLDCTEGYNIPPKSLVLGWTVEKIQLPSPSRIAGRLEGKSSLARIGLGIHVTAPTVHPGFGCNPLQPDYQGSPLRLEIWNFGPLKIRLTKGMALCQLIFEEVHGTPTQGYAGQFALQGPGRV